MSPLTTGPDEIQTARDGRGEGVCRDHTSLFATDFHWLVQDEREKASSPDGSGYGFIPAPERIPHPSLSEFQRGVCGDCTSPLTAGKEAPGLDEGGCGSPFTPGGRAEGCENILGLPPLFEVQWGVCEDYTPPLTTGSDINVVADVAVVDLSTEQLKGILLDQQLKDTLSTDRQLERSTTINSTVSGKEKVPFGFVPDAGTFRFGTDVPGMSPAAAGIRSCPGFLEGALLGGMPAGSWGGLEGMSAPGVSSGAAVPGGPLDGMPGEGRPASGISPGAVIPELQAAVLAATGAHVPPEFFGKLLLKFPVEKIREKIELISDMGSSTVIRNVPGFLVAALRDDYKHVP
ncbi:MAG: hypothetical protein ACPLRU_08340, partial [Desulfofundulus sp.]